MAKRILENRFQKGLIKELKRKFEGCMVLKNDASYIGGVPDLLVLYKDKWAALECKRDVKAMNDSKVDQPNQSRYVERMNNMSYASYIYPENKKEVLDDLERTFRTSG